MRRSVNRERKGNTVIVKDYIMDYISRQQLKAGDMLPSEGEIADQLEMSMSSVREATRSLESIGIIEKRHGIGMVLRYFNMDVLHELLKYAMISNPSLIIDLYEVRQLLEAALINQVIERFTAGQFNRLKDLLDNWRNKIEADQPVYDLDQKFHEILFEKIDNQLLVAFSRVFWRIYEYLESNGRISRLVPATPEMNLKTFEEHRHILEMVQAGNADLARRVLELHFNPIVEGFKVSVQKRRNA